MLSHKTLCSHTSISAKDIQKRALESKLDSGTMFLAVSLEGRAPATWVVKKCKMEKALGEETSVIIPNDYLPDSIMMVGA